MSFDFDPTNPTAGSLVSNFPANEQNSRQAIHDAYETEHTEATGRHKFGIGDTATRDGSSGIANGMIWFNTDRVAGEVLLDVYASGAWVETAFAMTDIVQKWTKAQFGTPVSVTPGAGSPNTLNWTLGDGAFFRAVITADTELKNPTATGLVAADMSHWVWQITQDGTGGWDLTFESPYFLPAYGGQPSVDLDPNAISIITITKIYDSTAFRYLYRVEHAA